MTTSEARRAGGLHTLLRGIRDAVEARKDPLRRAAELSDQFSYIHPRTDTPSPEQLLGLPSSQPESDRCGVHPRLSVHFGGGNRYPGRVSRGLERTWMRSNGI